MRHLKTDERGYPIPFFVPIIEGKPDFRYMDKNKQQLCKDKKLCSICGKRLFEKSFWFITGPNGLKNSVQTDPPMHEDCARFSLATCPHLQFEKAKRRTDKSTALPSQKDGDNKILYLIKADRVIVSNHFGNSHFHFHTVIWEEYRHELGALVLTNSFKKR